MSRQREPTKQRLPGQRIAWHWANLCSFHRKQLNRVSFRTLTENVRTVITLTGPSCAFRRIAFSLAT